MLTGLILFSVFGIIMIVLGLIVWKKQKTSLVHDYHCTKVSAENVEKYCATMGKGIILIGAGLIGCGVINYFASMIYGFSILAVSFIIAFVIMGKAQKKYNGGWF